MSTDPAIFVPHALPQVADPDQDPEQLSGPYEGAAGSSHMRVEPVFTPRGGVGEVLGGFLLAYRGATRAAYAADLRHFLVWAHAVIPEHDLLQISRAHIDAYVADTSAIGMAPATIAWPRLPASTPTPSMKACSNAPP